MYRLVWRQMILFAHNIVIYVVIAFIFPNPGPDLAVIPALLLIMLNCVWVSFCFGILPPVTATSVRCQLLPSCSCCSS